MKLRFHVSNKFSSNPAREGYFWAAQVSEGIEYYITGVDEINAWLNRSNIDYLHEFALYLFKTEQDLTLFLTRWS